MAIPPTHHLIQLLTLSEYDDLYGVPQFNNEERARFFALSLHDEAFIASFRSLQDKIYCLLCLGYFRAKQCLIDFHVNFIVADRRYLIDTYYPSQKTPRKLPSQAQKIRIQNKILTHEQAVRWNKKRIENTSDILMQLIKRHPKARPLTKALLNYFSEQRIALPAYSTLQRLISKTLSTEQNRIAHLYKKIITPQQKLLISQLLKQEDALYPISAIKQDVKNFSYTELTYAPNNQHLLFLLDFYDSTQFSN
jgi:hypothetical protein